MTFVGKILVVVQLMLSICFMAFAGAVYTSQLNWRDEAVSLRQQVESLQREMQQKQAEFDQQLKVKEDRALEAEGQLQAARGDAEDYKRMLDAKQQLLDAANTALAEQTKLATIAEEQAQAAQRESETLLGINDELIAAKNRLNAERLKLKDDVFSLERKVALVSERYEGVLDQVATLTNILRSSGLSTDPDDYPNLDSTPAPIVEGKVLNIARSERAGGSEFVDVSLGSDDGLRRGHSMFIYRDTDGGKYLGKIILTDVSADRAVGRVVQKPKNGTIERGDNVTTKL